MSRTGYLVSASAIAALALLTPHTQAGSPESADAERAQSSSQIIIDHPSGFHDAGFSVRLDAPAQGLVIYYTTNGTSPSPNHGISYREPIPVATTTILRAAGFEGRSQRTTVSCRTFIYPAAVPDQTGAGFPSTWGTREDRPVTAHYRLAGDLTRTPADRRVLIDALKALPVLSIISDAAGLFGRKSGIYDHPLEHGSHWERPGAVDFFYGDGRPGFAVDCGLRIHGGWSRRPEESPKHSFRLNFRPPYAEKNLEFPLLGSAREQRFSTLILRAGNNNSWLHPEPQERRRAEYLRDEWMRDSMAAMGYPSAGGIFVHLYLNGLYWGIYNLCEEPGGEADRSPAEFDIRKGEKILAGDTTAWNKLMALAEAGLNDAQNYKAAGALLDLTEFIDFLILNYYGANADWDRASNWYAIRPRDGKFRFFVWDAERTLEDPVANTLGYDDEQSPPHLFQKLIENADFRRLFSDRVKRLLRDEGPLAPGPAAGRFRTLAESIEKAMPAESARWGSYRRDVNPFRRGPYELYTVKEHWRPEIDRLLTEYFPKRTAIVWKGFQERGLAD